MAIAVAVTIAQCGTHIGTKCRPDALIAYAAILNAPRAAIPRCDAALPHERLRCPLWCRWLGLVAGPR